MTADVSEQKKDQAGYPDERWQELMRQAQDGDQQAYRALLNEISPLIKGYIMNRVGYLGVGDDLLQEILISIHRSRHTYDVSRPFSSWMFAIAKNRMIDQLRKMERQRKKETYDEHAIQSAVAPEQSSEVELQNEDLQQALNKLPEPHREAVILLKLQGLSVKEAAEQVGITPEALRVRAHRAYVALRKAMEESEYDEC